MDKMKLQTSPWMRKKVNTMKKKMRFDDEDLFLRYCLLKAYRPYATEKQKEDISKELKLINTYSNQR